MLHPTLALERSAILGCLAAATQTLGNLLPQLGSASDIEALHDFRVELRRLRTVLGTLDGVLPVADVAELVAECRWLAGRSGALRDSDVLLQELPNRLHSQPGGANVVTTRLQRELGHIRSRERRQWRATLRTRRVARLLERLRQLALTSPDAPGWPAQVHGATTLEHAWRRVLKQVQRMPGQPEPAALHELRKRCKRLRYLLEMYAPTLPQRDVEESARRLRKLQNALGDYQDAAVHATILATVHDAALAAGTLDDAYAELISELQAGFAESATAAEKRCAGRTAYFADRKSSRRRRGLFKSDRTLARPWTGTSGYCHGSVSGERIDLPVGKIVCVGRNYAAHAAELGNPVPETPLLFIKPASAAVDFAPFIRLPRDRGSVHHELEIAVLIGRELHAAGAEEARAAIAGIGLAIDLTLRDTQDQLKANRHPWELAKGFDGAAPLSAFVALDPALDLAALQMRLAVNGRRRQFGSSAQMLTPIIALICYASAQFSLWPGDVVLTGTPQGVGPLAPGDRLSAELNGLVRVRSLVV